MADKVKRTKTKYKSIYYNEEQLSYFYDEDHSNASYTITFSNLKQ